jgi:hypothetical protein
MHKQKDHTATGPDSIPAPLIKFAPRALALAIATFTLVASEYLYFPPEVTDGLISYLFKGGDLIRLLAASYRPIRCTSLLGKIVEHLPASAAFPPHTMMESILPPEQFAGRKGFCAEQLALLLHCIIHMRGITPTFILLLDISKAFDRTWREALFVKLSRRGGHKRTAAQLAALYRKLRSRVKCGDELSEVIEAALGIGQGSPNSTHLYAFLLGDLPDILKEEGLGITVFNLLITALLFLDDIAIPLCSPAQINTAFSVLDAYAKKWGLKFNMSKCAVLCYNFPYPPQAWPFGEGSVRTSTLEKYLTNKITSDGTSTYHVETRLKKAKAASGVLFSLGLLGGAHKASASSTLVKSFVWPIIDSGRTLADLHLPKHSKLRLRLDTYQLSVGRAILGVTPSCPSDGVIGELGWMPDNLRGDLRNLLCLRRLCILPHFTLQKNFFFSIMMNMISSPNAKTIPPYFKHCIYLCNIMGINISLLESTEWKPHVKSICWRATEVMWHQRLEHQPKLRLVYPSASSLRMQPYLELPPFPGRNLLTRMRLADYPLATHSFKGTLSRLCPCCEEHAQETRAHFLLQCPAYQQIRQAHKRAIPALKSRAIGDCVRQLQDLLLVIDPDANPSQVRATGAYILDIANERSRITGIFVRWSVTSLPYQ